MEYKVCSVAITGFNAWIESLGAKDVKWWITRMTERIYNSDPMLKPLILCKSLELLLGRRLSSVRISIDLNWWLGYAGLSSWSMHFMLCM